MKPRRLASPTAALGAGALLAMSFPGFDHGWLVWAWMPPLLWALWLPSRPPEPAPRRALRGFALGYLAGLGFFLLNLSWLSHIHLSACTLLPAFLALYFGAWGAFAATVGRPGFIDAPAPAESDDPWEFAVRPAMQSIACAALNAGAWCGLEWVRGWFLTGFGWNGLGVALHDELVFAQCADLVGVTGLAFLVAFPGSILAAVLVRLRREIAVARLRPHYDFAAAVVLLVAAFFYGSGKLSARPGETIGIRTLLVQGGVPQTDKVETMSAANDAERRVLYRDAIQAIYDHYYKQTNEFLQFADFDLVIWPESSLPYSLGDPHNRDYLDDLLAVKDFELVLGLNERVPTRGDYNSIVALRGDSASARTYRKVHLVPFGEYVPLRDRFPFLEKIASNALGKDFLAGETTAPLPMTKPEPYGIIPLVCFEDTFGDLARRFVRDGEPQLIVNVTNDGWFGESAASAQHFANARFRCIELRRPMARCANTGFTCIIDSAGSLHDRWGRSPDSPPRLFTDREGSTFGVGRLADEIQISRNPPTTLYARIGDAFSISLGSLALAAAALQALRRLKRRRPTPPEREKTRPAGDA